MEKVLLLTYHQIPGVPRGRYEKGNIIVYSDEYYERYEVGVVGARTLKAWMQAREAGTAIAVARTIAGLSVSFASDLPRVDTVYFYVGQNAASWILSLIAGLRTEPRKKKVVMISCRCERDKKERFAKEFGVEIIWDDCGGHKACMQIVERFSQKQEYVH